MSTTQLPFPTYLELPRWAGYAGQELVGVLVGPRRADRVVAVGLGHHDGLGRAAERQHGEGRVDRAPFLVGGQDLRMMCGSWVWKGGGGKWGRGWVGVLCLY
jgi:hypothetical protein